MHELEGIQLASFPRRAIAFSFDFLLVAVAFGLLIACGTWLAMQFGYKPGDTSDKQSFSITNWYSLVALAVYHGLLVHYWDGQTVGKRLMRIRVISVAHKHVSLWHAVERALGYGASALELGFGFFQYFITENRQTTHDRIAETIVVTRSKAATQPLAVPESLRRRPMPKMDEISHWANSA